MDFDKIKQNILNSSETSTSESESISGSELHEEFEINNFLPEFEPLKLSGKNLAQQYVSAFNTGMNVYQCLNYLQGYVYTLVTAMNETIEAWNTVVPLLEQATKEWTDEEFDYKWSILKPQVIELVTNLTIETFNKAWEDLKPVVIKLAQDTTDAEFKKQWDILKPQVITLVEETTTNKFNEEWEKLKPTIIQLSTDTTIAQFNRSWEELKPQVIELAQTTTSNKFDEKWEELRPQIIELAQTTTSNNFDEKWEALQPTLTETVNNLAKTQTTTTFNEKWEELKPQVIELAQTTTNTKFDEKWTELQPTLTETVNNLVNTNLETFKTTLWQEVTKNNVSLIKVGTDQYYVLTESKDKNVKKLDYYFKFDLDYLPAAPYYSNNLFVRDLDLEGYTVKRSYLSDNTCKLKNKSTGELIDYVYLILDDNVTVTTSKGDPQLTYTTIAIKYLPYFAKLKTDTPVAGQLHVDMCISIILEKTSS